jgi:repressor LexA
MENIENIELKKIFGKRLKEVRDSKGMSGRAVGAIIGVAGATISRYESGEIEAKRTTIKVLADYFKVNPVWLMGVSEDKYVESDMQSKALPIYNIENKIVGYEFVDESSNIDSCVLVNSDTMTGSRIFKNDIAFLRKVTKLSEIETGEIIYVTEPGEICPNLKRIHIISNTIILKSENPAFKDAVYSKKDFKELKVLGVCISVKFNLSFKGE